MKYWFAAILLALVFYPSSTRATEAVSSIVNLPVPFVWEIPDGIWVKPWNGACEEASVTMVEQFYLGNIKLNLKSNEQKNLMRPFFGIEDAIFGSNVDTDSTRTAKLINDYTSFLAKIKTNPTLEDIKKELSQGHPVISPHYGYDLKNPLHRYRRGGSSYHMMVITGFDDVKREFLANDPELKHGLDFPYSYDIFMASLHDFNHTTKKADGPPVVIFTASKKIVKAAGSNRLFLISNDKKYYISSPKLFKIHRWSWSIVKEVEKGWLETLPNGNAITN